MSTETRFWLCALVYALAGLWLLSAKSAGATDQLSVDRICAVVTAAPHDWNRAACERTASNVVAEVRPGWSSGGSFAATTPGTIVVRSVDYLDHEMRHAWDAQHGYEPAAVKADLARLAAEGGPAGEAARDVLRYQSTSWSDDQHLNHNLLNRVSVREVPGWYKAKRLGYLNNRVVLPLIERR